MTLAVILGLWCALMPWSATGATVAAYQDAPAQQPKPPDAGAQTAPDQTPPSAAPAESTTQKTESTATPAVAKPKKKTHKKKSVSSDPPSKIVVRNGSTNEATVKLSPAETQKQTSNKIQNVNQLLAGTDANLKLISGKT